MSLTDRRRLWRVGIWTFGVCVFALLFFVTFAPDLLAHGVSGKDKAFMEQPGRHLVAFIYLGAKHMVTGYDHLLFLFGVIFFLYRLRDVGAYVTPFAFGHSVTLLYGVLSGTHVNAFLVDAMIGFSVVYKALDNLGAFRRVLGFQPNTKAAVLIFGFFHGFGLATKLQNFKLSPDGLIPNILAFNVGVELGQLIVLASILIAMGYWRRSASFGRYAFAANVIVMTCGWADARLSGGKGRRRSSDGRAARCHRRAGGTLVRGGHVVQPVRGAELLG